MEGLERHLPIDEYNNHSKDAERLMEIVGASLTAGGLSDNRRSGEDWFLEEVEVNLR